MTSRRSGAGRPGSLDEARELVTLISSLSDAGDSLSADAVAERLGIDAEEGREARGARALFAPEGDSGLPLIDDAGALTLADSGGRSRSEAAAHPGGDACPARRAATPGRGRERPHPQDSELHALRERARRGAGSTRHGRRAGHGRGRRSTCRLRPGHVRAAGARLLLPQARRGREDAPGGRSPLASGPTTARGCWMPTTSTAVASARSASTAWTRPRSASAWILPPRRGPGAHRAPGAPDARRSKLSRSLALARPTPDRGAGWRARARGDPLLRWDVAAAHDRRLRRLRTLRRHRGHGPGQKLCPSAKTGRVQMSSSFEPVPFFQFFHS